MRPATAVAGIGAIAAVAFVVLRVTSGPTPPAFVHQPDQNVLLITIDTLRADAVGCYGGRAPTPNIDALAAQGMRFDSAHSHAVVTLPSHASILTGLYPTQHGIHDNYGFRLAPSVPTLASRLKAQGFATGAFVGAFPVDSRFGLTTGFDTYDDRYPGTSGGREFVLPERRAAEVVAVANRWLSRRQGKWLAWVHLFDPHAPYRPPAPFDREYAGAPYFGEVAYTDSVLASLLGAAAAASGGRPTLVIITGDHGEGLGDHGEQTHGVFAYESTLRIPLIVAQLPAGNLTWNAPPAPAAGAGYVVPAPVSHVDIVPTALDLLKLPAATDLPGRSLMATAAARDSGGPAPGSYFEALTASLNRGWAPLRGVVQGHEKYIDLPLPELYDLHADPREGTNLADRSAERLRVLDVLLKGFPNMSAAVARSSSDPEASARLRALGYVSGNAAKKDRYTDADDPKRLIAVDQEIHHVIDLYQHGRAAEAVPICEQVVAEHPGMEVAYSYLAMLQWELGTPAAAVGTLRTALARGLDSTAIRAKLGAYLAESGRGNEAIPLLETAVAGDLPDLDALNALGIALASVNRTREAEASFRRILQVSPANAMALENLGSIALGRRDYEAARDFFTRSLESDPASAQSHNGLGVVEMTAGHRKAAIDHWKRSVALDATNFYALFNVGMELVNDGQPNDARPYLERFARTAPPALYAADIRTVQAVLARISGVR